VEEMTPKVVVPQIDVENPIYTKTKEIQIKPNA